MAMTFADSGTYDLYNGIFSKAARRTLPVELVPKALDKLTLLEAAESLDQLRMPPGNRLEALRGDRAGQFAIRINDRYRICFRWTRVGATDVAIVDYHR
jgi:proteic killer suppression protein